eukprot:scaffold1221_cov207-Amphora_coffeaeformis.AAC.48
MVTMVSPSTMTFARCHTYTVFDFVLFLQLEIEMNPQRHQSSRNGDAQDHHGLPDTNIAVIGAGQSLQFGPDIVLAAARSVVGPIDGGRLAILDTVFRQVMTIFFIGEPCRLFLLLRRHGACDDDDDDDGNVPIALFRSNNQPRIMKREILAQSGVRRTLGHEGHKE